MQKNSFESVAYKDHILDIGEQSNDKVPMFLKLKKDNFPKKKEIFEILKNSSDLSRLAKELAQHVIEEKQINLKNPLFKSYHCALKKEKVIDTKNKKFHVDFIDGHNLSLSAKKFRDLFQEEASKIKKLPEKDILNEIKGKKLNLSKAFGEIFQLNDNPQITNADEFAKAIAELITVPPQKPTVISRKKNLIINNIDELAGHILISEDEDKDQKIKFRPAFLNVADTSLQGIGNLEEFKNKLKVKLNDKQINFDQLGQHEFKINKFITCEEGQQHFQNTLPNDFVADEHRL